MPPILEFLKGISATKCNLPSHVLKWAIFLTYTEDFWISSWGVGGKRPLYVFAPPLKMGKRLPKHEFGDVWTTFWGS